jgi:pimeloyl-ACP methyl ester carboxylesterase
VCALALLSAASCADLTVDPAPSVIIARFDPTEKVIPMPTDILRDDALGRLDIPIDEDTTEAEAELYTYLNTLDGWSSATSATVEFSGPVAPATLTGDTVQVWHLPGALNTTPERVTDVTMHFDDSETELTIDPPRTGWERGGRYLVVVRGGAAGLEGKRGEPVIADAAFYFLRLTERLDTGAHDRAFPGATAAERAENAADLEEVRVELAEHFEFLERHNVSRDEVASLFSFTITAKTELAMDKTSQRMPLPIDLLIDPETGRVDLPAAAWDSQTVVEAKTRLAEYDGFGTSAKLLFGFTGPIDRSTVDSDSVALYRVDGASPVRPIRIDAEVAVLDDNLHVEVEPKQQGGAPLEEQTRYAIALSRSIRDADGEPIVRMPIGQLLMARTPLTDAGKSQIGSVADADAARLERVRGELEPALGGLGRDGLLAAWSFTTMTIDEPVRALVTTAGALGASADPKEVDHMTPLQALVDFPLAVASLLFVDDVYTGSLETVDFLDPQTRGWRGDGSHQISDIKFTLTLPDVSNLEPGAGVPVMIFGHGVMTERRFVLAIGDALAARGYAAIAIDLPYHGERTACFAEGPLSIPNPTTGELTPLGNPCADGGVCMPDGLCQAATGGPGELARWPVIGMYRSSGAAFLEIEHIANTRDHFRQALIDLGALYRSLREGDWESAVGVRFDPTQIHYAGQSLGGILGASFVALEPGIKRAVLNVPGADTVDMFEESPFFSGQIDAFFNREGVDPASFDGHRFLNVARWFMDAVDPHSVAEYLRGREVLLQMATLDFIIPNTYTEKLEALSGAPRRDYIAEHAFLVIPIEPAYLPGTLDMAAFIDGDL